MYFKNFLVAFSKMENYIERQLKRNLKINCFNLKKKITVIVKKKKVVFSMYTLHFPSIFNLFFVYLWICFLCVLNRFDQKPELADLISTDFIFNVKQ